MPLSQCVGPHQHARGGAAGSEQIHVLECRNGNTLSAGIHVLECSTHMGTCVSHVPTGTCDMGSSVLRDLSAASAAPVWCSGCVSPPHARVRRSTETNSNANADGPASQPFPHGHVQTVAICIPTWPFPIAEIARLLPLALSACFGVLDSCQLHLPKLRPARH